ncbi:hypothetical protein [Dactylosporangium salmoneum]|uniref:TIR domain-containing protein n=1 Tax=Dactylosporangium salmoneum TaxID=53361 RepID=A0ABN3FR06_9ACTN
MLFVSYATADRALVAPLVDAVEELAGARLARAAALAFVVHVLVRAMAGLGGDPGRSCRPGSPR